MTNHPHHLILQSYIEQELNPSQEMLIHDHLGQCDRCSNLALDLAQVDRMILANSISFEIPRRVENDLFTQANLLLAKKAEKKQHIEQLHFLPPARPKIFQLLPLAAGLALFLYFYPFKLHSYNNLQSFDFSPTLIVSENELPTASVMATRDKEFTEIEHFITIEEEEFNEN